MNTISIPLSLISTAFFNTHMQRKEYILLEFHDPKIKNHKNGMQIKIDKKEH